MNDKELRKKLRVGFRKKEKTKIPKFLKRIIIAVCIIIVAYAVNIALGFISTPVSVAHSTLPLNDINISLDENADPDTDGISTKEELNLKTNPFNRDTDGDRLTDDGDKEPLNFDENALNIHDIKYLKPFSYKGVTFYNSSLKSFTQTKIKTITTESFTKFIVSDFEGEIDSELFVKNSSGKFIKANKTKNDSEFIVFKENPETITSISFAGNSTFINSKFLGGFAKFFLPKKGLICAYDNLKSDYSPKTLIINNSLKDLEYATEVIKNLGDSRFNLLHNDVSYITYLDNKLNMKEAVPFSIISKNKEFIGFITGKYNTGDYAIYDAKTGKYAGDLSLFVTAKQMSDGKTLTMLESLDFEAGNLSSENGDRLIFLN